MLLAVPPVRERTERAQNWEYVYANVLKYVCYVILKNILYVHLAMGDKVDRIKKRESETYGVLSRERKTATKLTQEYNGGVSICGKREREKERKVYKMILSLSCLVTLS